MPSPFQNELIKGVEGDSFGRIEVQRSALTMLTLPGATDPPIVGRGAVGGPHEEAAPSTSRADMLELLGQHHGPVLPPLIRVGGPIPAP